MTGQDWTVMMVVASAGGFLLWRLLKPFLKAGPKTPGKKDCGDDCGCSDH